MCKTVNCGWIAGIIGAIFGIIIGILFYMGTIAAAAIVTPIIIAMSVAGAVLLLVLISLIVDELSGGRAPICLFQNAPGLVVTSILTILTGIASFAITLISGSVSIALLIGIGAAVFLAMLILLICYSLCVTVR